MVDLAFQDRPVDLLAGEDGEAAALLNADLQYLCSPVVDSRFGDPNAKLP